VTILVDSSVWIDLLNDRTTPQTIMGRRLLSTRKALAVGDLALIEVLQGTRDDRDYRYKLACLGSFDHVTITDRQIAVAATQHYRTLHSRGVMIRKTINTLIATRCIHDAIPLLYSDRDYDPFVQDLGLRSAMDLDLGVT
jgi:predicted nucleic acid-binding protein